MASLYQKATGRRQPNSPGRNGDRSFRPQPYDERLSHHRWVSEPRDQQVATSANRLRSQTMSSAMSFYAASNSDSSAAPFRDISPHLTQDRSTLALEKKENTAKSLLSKSSRILRKHGSKFSLSSLYTLENDSGDRFLGGPAPTNRHLRFKDQTNPTEVIKREGLKRIISEPYDFQHVTHTDRGFLNSMLRVPKTELVGEFSALRAGQASKPQLRGIRAEALPIQKQNDSFPTSPVEVTETDSDLDLPQTPTRPTPPPKDEVSPLSPAKYAKASRSIENFSRPSPSSIISPITPPRRYSSRSAMQPSLTSPLRPLRAYTHTPPSSANPIMAESCEDPFVDCNGAGAACEKPLPGLPSVHAITTNDDSARHLRVAALPRTPLELADVPEEDEQKRQSVIAPQVGTSSMPVSNDMTQNFAVDTAPTRTSIVQDVTTISPSNDNVDVDDWDDAIDYSWDHATEPEANAQSPLSRTDQAASVVVVATLTTPERDESAKIDHVDTRLSTLPCSKFETFESKTEQEVDQPRRETQEEIGQAATLDTENQDLKRAIHELFWPDRSSTSALLGLGIDVQQPWQEVLQQRTTPTPAVDSGAPNVSDNDSSLTSSFNSDFSVASTTSKSSSQESIIWSIASSIMGTRRSSYSSRSLLDHLPDFPRAAKSIDDLKGALESVQENLREKDGEQTADSSRHLSYPPGKPSHRRAQSLLAEFVFGNTLRPLNSSSNSRRGSRGHRRVPSDSLIPIPARKSSANASAREPAELGRPPARRMRSATTIARSRHASRTSYSLFPGNSPREI